MTYKDVVNRVQTVVNDHLILADFGYGDLSDLKTRFENTSGDNQVQADYPYAFLNPGQHSRNQSAVTYNFNLIVMDMARGEVSDDPYNNMLTIQSQCQQYIDDIIARLYYYYKDQPQVLFNSMTYTPFNERFQDDVAGMTANLQILVPNAIDECVAPYDPDCTITLPIFSRNSTNGATRNPNNSTRVLRYTNYIDSNLAIGAWLDQWYNSQVIGDFEIEIVQTFEFTEPGIGQVLPERPVLYGTTIYGPGKPTPIQPTCDSGNWPTVWSAEPVTYSAIYNFNIENAEQQDFISVGFADVPIDRSSVFQVPGGTLTIGYNLYE